MSEFSATRNTCFAIISSIEDDFRSMIIAFAESIGLATNILPDDVREVCQRRRMSDSHTTLGDSSVQVTDVDFLPYIDFADISKIIDARIKPRADPYTDWLTTVSRKLVSLTSSRNRVCHTRPLEPDDLPKTVDLANYLLAANTPYQFPSLTECMRRLEQSPSFVLTLQIPNFWSAGISRPHNNLPLPEFDETGFLGRSADRLHVTKLIKSHCPVVTIVGEGGIGKTALALRCLYDLLDDPNENYDAIVWISLKTAALTKTGVRDLTGAIKTTLGILSEIASQFGNTQINSMSEDELIDEIVEYLELYRIVIAIDNLETISVGALRSLLEKIPPRSKILLTSRIGVGEFEVRYPLKELDEKTSISLIRNYSRILGVSEIFKLDDGNLKGYSRKLFNNPLLIKWFVASVGNGSDPSRLISPEGTLLSEALSFCFENLFERFGEQERTIIHCLASARKSLSSAEIRFLLPNISDFDVEVALSALHNSSVVSRNKSEGQIFEYSLSESSVKFLSQKYPPSADFFKSVQAKLRDLRKIFDQESQIGFVYEYSPYFVRVGNSRDEKIAATYLRSALNYLKVSDVDNARSTCAKCVDLTPSYGEAWRIFALVEEQSQDFYKASEYYDQAVILDPTSKISLYCYGMFLMTDMDDLTGALDKFLAAEKIDPDAPPLLTARAMCLMRQGKLEDSLLIHEKLLPSIKDRGRRWRITGVDQAVDCYSRLAANAKDMKEFGKVKDYCKSALGILLGAAERTDLDQKLIQRTVKLVSIALGKMEVINDFDYVEFIISTIEKIYDLSGRPHINFTLSSDWQSLKSCNGDGHNLRLMALDRRNMDKKNIQGMSNFNGAETDLDLPARIYGLIHNVASSGRYGFVTNVAGDRWFTHSEFMRYEEEWKQCKAGTPVSFCIGQNPRGACAVDVCLI